MFLDGESKPTALKDLFQIKLIFPIPRDIWLGWLLWFITFTASKDVV